MILENENGATSSGDSSGQTGSADGGSPTASDSASGAGGAASGVSSDGTTDPNAAPAYTPNFKFKHVNGDGKDAEAEIDDLFKPLVKSADVEKKIRELHEKAYGIDFVKADRGKLQQTHAQVSGELAELKAGVDQLRTFVANRDLDSFFEGLQIPQNLVLQWALEKAQYAKMTPEQRAQVDARRDQTRQLSTLQQQNQSLAAQAQQASAQARTQELDMTLTRPEIAATVTAFDSRAGRAGAFRSEVIRRAQHHALTTGEDISAEAVIMEMTAMYAPFLAAATAPAAPQGQATTTTQAKPVIPNIGGRGTSPAKKVPKSLDDLRAMAKAAAEAGA